MLMGSISSTYGDTAGQNNYDFLADDNIQHSLQAWRYQNFAEKLTISFALKETLSEMSQMETFMLEACRS
jgi:hypothetical protein